MPFLSLWLPVVVATVVVWIVSALIWMLLGYHNKDFRKFPDEERFRALYGDGKIAPGQYVTPYWQDAKGKDDKEFMKRFEGGPVGLLVVGRNGQPNMGRNMALSLLFYFVVSFIVAYIARHTLSFTTDSHTVMRVTGTIAVAIYALAGIPDSIWFWRPWSVTLKNCFDGVIYGLVTGATFMLLWPAAH
ncbi:MAG: hypothetical protein MUF27_10605 [Acidobacteria bacterium]|jgi:hypothetical protein|nr:hypothetical protein [Acidobacteriota bacterium]